MEVALALLGRRALSAARVRERIAEKCGEDEAERVVTRLLGLGILDDRKYAEAFARDRFLRAGYGRSRIRADLLARGVAAADADAAIAAVVDPESERTRAEHALERFRRTRGARIARARSTSGGAESVERDVGPGGRASARVTDHARRKLREAAFRHLIARGFGVDLVRALVGGLD